MDANAGGSGEGDHREVNNNLTAAHTGKRTPAEDASVAKLLVRKASLQEIIQAAEDTRLRSEYRRKGRSLSDGLITKKSSQESLNSEAFPSLPNEVLEKLGLHGDRPRERLSEHDLEQKFTSLALAFSIDSATVKDRCERQRRNRDQTEINLSMEIERLIEQIDQLQSMCTDIRQAELLSTVSAQISTIMQAVQLVSIAAERYGSVQHEERLTESVGLMVDHVQMLKQQRDSARRQLQYTKKVLQNSSDSTASAPSTQRTIVLASGKKFLTKRRASVATFTQTVNEFGTTVDVKKFTRRVSDLSLRASSLNKGIRPNRLELIGDLDKIKEGLVETPLYNEPEEEIFQEEDESVIKNETRVTENNNLSVASSQDNKINVIDYSKLSLREKIHHKTTDITGKLRAKYHTWCVDGTIHEICCFCALICFSMSLLSMMNILLGYGYAKRGLKASHIFWFWNEEQSR
ncbi:unnamed protein product [Callosobruchus maculatus]|uniref:Uncharacterized protein n=1 Tax=Callosobruchus maculatus TaxID=64391 RepID=A0A653DR51_CALMS|nr:unnamed protein product [Callosobruchus maculatus]